MKKIKMSSLSKSKARQTVWVSKKIKIVVDDHKINDSEEIDSDEEEEEEVAMLHDW